MTIKPSKPEPFSGAARDGPEVNTWLYLVDNYFTASGLSAVDSGPRLLCGELPPWQCRLMVARTR